jgi:hypothetical protein
MFHTEMKVVIVDLRANGIFLKFDHPIYENDTSPFGKGGPRGIFQVDSLLNPPGPPFSKGGILSILVF